MPPPRQSQPAPALPPGSSVPGADSSVPAPGVSAEESPFMATQIDEAPQPKSAPATDLQERLIESKQCNLVVDVYSLYSAPES